MIQYNNYALVPGTDSESTCFFKWIDYRNTVVSHPVITKVLDKVLNPLQFLGFIRGWGFIDLDNIRHPVKVGWDI